MFNKRGRNPSPNRICMKCIISTDWHLRRNNITEIQNLVFQQIELAERKNCSMLFCLGDVFDSRVSQREEVLNAFTDILGMIAERRMMLTCIPGNHDKTDYKGDRSFLTPFRGHRCLNLIEEPLIVDGPEFNMCFMPFYDNDVWMSKLPSDIPENTILFSHIAVNGSVNNDGSEVESKIIPSFLRKFKRVYLGHYHNRQKISDFIYHLPSIRQNNFGENEDKGFCCLDERGEIEFVRSNFDRYISLSFDLSKVNTEVIQSTLEECNDYSHIKVELIGTESEIKGFDKGSLSDSRITLRLKKKVHSVGDSHAERGILLTRSNVKILFKDFCKERRYDFTEGYRFLEKYVEDGTKEND